MGTTSSQQKICERRNLIAAYVDGELEQDLTRLLEEHLPNCISCRAELRAHRLLVCELEAALIDGAEIPVPADFSRRIATRATSDMSGVRTRSENRKALVICLILALTGFALIGARARDGLFTLAQKLIATAFGVISFVASTAYDTVATLIVILRVLSRKIIVESGSWGPLLVLLGVAIFILSRLISNYHRPGATE
ncbi:MAG TPA: zf-HC2 domain-containing protein [Pyrinomonadaceae bacterium]|nr:zf-HC2 domain-containing protein [Pyrinomonadaceae bacterium]